MRIAVVGSGGHAKVVRDTIDACGSEFAGFLDPMRDPETRGDIPIIDHLPSDESTFLAIGIGDNELRKEAVRKIRDLMGESDARWAPPLIHPSASVSSSALIGPGSVISAGANVGPEAQLGEHCLVNTMANVEHDARLGPYSALAPGAMVGGASRMGEGAFIAMGATVIQGRSVGEWSWIGAQALVLEDVPASELWFGQPAKYVRKLIKGESPFTRRP